MEIISHFVPSPMIPFAIFFFFLIGIKLDGIFYCTSLEKKNGFYFVVSALYLSHEEEKTKIAVFKQRHVLFFQKYFRQ